MTALFIRIFLYQKYIQLSFFWSLEDTKHYKLTLLDLSWHSNVFKFSSHEHQKVSFLPTQYKNTTTVCTVFVNTLSCKSTIQKHYHMHCFCKYIVFTKTPQYASFLSIHCIYKNTTIWTVFVNTLYL